VPPCLEGNWRSNRKGGESVSDEKKQPKKRRRAVIVGINKYKDRSNIPDLEGAENDAEEIYERLINPDIGGFEIPDDHYLRGEEAKCEQIRKAISDIFWESEPQDLALFYFSGHGFEDGHGNGYIAPFDMLKNKPFVYGINMQELRHVFSNPVNKANIMILDSCYSGIATKGDMSLSDDFFKELGEGRFILASSEGDQVSKEVKLRHENEKESHTHGAFSFYLIEGVDGKAADKDEKIFLDQLYIYVEKQLRAMGKQKSKVYMADASGFSALQIAVSEKYSKNIQTKIGDAENYYLTENPVDLIDAVNRISEVLNINAKNEKALNIKKKVSDTLTDYKGSVISWLLDNELDDDCRPIRNIFSELHNLAAELDFDKITKLEKRKKTLLVNLCLVSKEKLVKNQFIDICKVYYSSPKIEKLITGVLK